MNTLQLNNHLLKNAIMSNWIPNIGQYNLPKYKSLAKAIQQDVEAGRLKPGDRLLPHREMAKKLGITMETVARAYRLASSWGYVDSKVGKGSVIANPNQVTENIPINFKDNYHNFGVLQPAPITDPELKNLAYVSTLEVVGESWKSQAFIGYPPEFGYKHQREAGAVWLERRGMNASPAEVLVTLGTQEAYHLLLSVYANAGDTILVEEYTNFAFKNLCLFLGLNIVGLAMDDEGVIPESLNESVAQTKAKLLFLTPTYNSPTTVTMGPERRKQIIEIAEHHNLFIIENDPYSELIEDTPPPLAFYAPDRTAYVTTLSFLGPPEIRIGYLKVPLRNVPELQTAKRVLSISSPLITSEIATHWINTGILDDLIKWQIDEVATRNKIAKKYLKGCDYSCAPNGQFLWLRLPEPWRSTDFAVAAKDRNIIVIEADRFAVGRDRTIHAVRIALTSPKRREMMRIGLQNVVALMNNFGKIPPL